MRIKVRDVVARLVALSLGPLHTFFERFCLADMVLRSFDTMMKLNREGTRGSVKA
jgi:hypothetical protein